VKLNQVSKRCRIKNVRRLLPSWGRHKGSGREENEGERKGTRKSGKKRNRSPAPEGETEPLGREGEKPPSRKQRKDRLFRGKGPLPPGGESAKKDNPPSSTIIRSRKSVPRESSSKKPAVYQKRRGETLLVAVGKRKKKGRARLRKPRLQAIKGNFSQEGDELGEKNCKIPSREIETGITEDPIFYDR